MRQVARNRYWLVRLLLWWWTLCGWRFAGISLIVFALITVSMTFALCFIFCVSTILQLWQTIVISFILYIYFSLFWYLTCVCVCVFVSGATSHQHILCLTLSLLAVAIFVQHNVDLTQSNRKRIEIVSTANVQRYSVRLFFFYTWLSSFIILCIWFGDCLRQFSISFDPHKILNKWSPSTQLHKDGNAIKLLGKMSGFGTSLFIVCWLSFLSVHIDFERQFLHICVCHSVSPYSPFDGKWHVVC